MIIENAYKSNDVAIRIKEILKNRNIKQKEMYNTLGISDRTLDNYKTSMPKADNLAKIADSDKRLGKARRTKKSSFFSLFLLYLR